jgi:DnaJ-class molecular chaperone
MLVPERHYDQLTGHTEEIFTPQPCPCGGQPQACSTCHGDGEISALDAVFRRNPCPTCPGDGWQTCRTCLGGGFIMVADPDSVDEHTGQHHLIRHTCPTCEGHKMHSCLTCHGDGDIGVLDYLGA